MLFKIAKKCPTISIKFDKLSIPKTMSTVWAKYFQAKKTFVFTSLMMKMTSLVGAKKLRHSVTIARQLPHLRILGTTKKLRQVAAIARQSRHRLPKDRPHHRDTATVPCRLATSDIARTTTISPRKYWKAASMVLDVISCENALNIWRLNYLQQKWENFNLLLSYPPASEASRGVYWNQAQQNFTHPY